MSSGESLGDAGLVWIAFDTPVDEEDQADVQWVLDRTVDALVHAARGALVVLSTQLPVGSTLALAARIAHIGRGDLSFACAPENVRLGQALPTFRSPDRFVAGVRRLASHSPNGHQRLGH